MMYVVVFLCYFAEPESSDVAVVAIVVVASVVLAAVTLGGLSRCFLSKQRVYNAVVCDRSSCSHTTLLQRFVLGERVFKKP